MVIKQIKNTVYGATSALLIRLLGILIFLLGLTILISLISYNAQDSYFGFTTTNKTQNLLGYFGAYTSGTLLNYLDAPSYLIPALLLIWGIKLTFGITIKNKILRIISLIFSILILGSVYVSYSLYENIIGNLIHSSILSIFYGTTNNINIIIIGKVITGIILVPAILISLSISNKYLLYILNFILKIIKYLVVQILKLFLLIFKTKKSAPNIEIRRQDPVLSAIPQENYKIKTEPTIARRKKIKNLDENQSVFNFDENFNYELPGLNLLKTTSKINENYEESNKDLENKAIQLENVLAEFGIQGKISDVRPGPIITMYELEPSAGTKSSRIINLSDDIARSMSALSARISSQPGRNVIGIELPNKKRMPVFLSEILAHNNYNNSDNNLVLALGKDTAGTPVIADLERMPHLLIAGTTGSGKSVGLNSMIISLLYKFKPSECRFILIDPKMLELSIYEDIPHLLTPVVTDPYKAIVALKWAVKEMENRYRFMNHAGVKNIVSYNEKIKDLLKKGVKMYREVTTGIDPDTRLPLVEKKEIPNETFPYIVVVIDEMADLMMVAGKDVEQAIQRLAQMARAAGIHIIMATQRPSVDVITGTIKANFPSRISYHVASKFDSRTILNEMGAEQLLGSGDMLFMENGGRIKRLHGGFISETEISNIVKFIKKQSKPDYSQDVTTEEALASNNLDFNLNNDLVDELYNKAVQLVLTEKKASTSFVQRHLQIGYNRAARIIEQMEKEGLISEANHVGKREVLKSSD